MNEKGQIGIAGVDYSMTCPCVCVFKYDFIDKFNFDPEFDVHQNIKYSGEIRQGEKICYEYTYIHTYMDTIKILTNMKKVNNFP